MKQKPTKYPDNQHYSTYQFSMESPSQPVKSPSPDKKRAKLITPTKSPQLIDIKRNLVQSKLQQKKLEKTPLPTKPHEQSTRYYTNEDFQQYRSSHKKNQIFQELQNMLPQEFSLDNNQLYRSAINPNSKQLDYIKLLQQKEKTIKQLHEIIEMINRNNSLEFSTSSASNTKNKRIFDNSGILSRSPGNQTAEKQLKNQVRILTIENQQLIHMIEKLNQEKRSYEDLQKSLMKEKIDYNAHRMKEEILSRQIYEMKESLIQKDEDCNALIKQNKDLYSKYIQLDQENQKLIKMMKDKELSDRKYHSSLIESNITQKSNISESQLKEKVSIQKIKEQYNESLKVFKDTVYGDLEEFMREIESNWKGLEGKLNEMEEKVRTLEKFKRAYENLGTSKLVGDVHEISQIHEVSPDKERYKEIESLLMQKTDGYERELSTQRRTNQELSQELQGLREKYQLLYSKYSQVLEKDERAHPEEQLRESSVKLSVSPERSSKDVQKSPQRNIQIQDINEAKARQAEIHKLCELIQKCQREFSQEKNNLLKEISVLKKKNESYEKIIECQRQQFEQKQNDVKTRISEKENQLKRNQSVYKSQIDHLKELLSEKSIVNQGDKSLGVQGEGLSQVEEARKEVEELKKSLQVKELEIQQKSGEIVELREKLQGLEETQEQAKEEIKKLVDNYQTQINILRNDKLVEKEKHNKQIEEFKKKLSQVEEISETQQIEIKRLLNQSQNAQLLLSQSQTQAREQISKLKQRLIEMQRELNNKNRESRELLNSKEALQVEHSELKEHIEQLLVISSHVEQIQEENKQMRQTIMEYEREHKHANELRVDLEKRITLLEGDKDIMGKEIREKDEEISEKENEIEQLQNKVHEDQATIIKLQQAISKLQQSNNQLEEQMNLMKSRVSRVRKQSEDIKKENQIMKIESEQIIRQNQGIKKENLDILNQNHSILKQTQQNHSIFMKTKEQAQRQKQQYERIIKELNTQISNLNTDLQMLREDNSHYYQAQNQLLHLKHQNLLPQLYQLRSLLTSNLGKLTNNGTQPHLDKQTHYDLGKLTIDYQSKIDQNLSLQSKIDQLQECYRKSQQQKLLLQQKIHFLQKNILIYQNQLKDRKTFCQQLIRQNNQLDKQLLLIKKLKLQSKQLQNDSLKSSLIQRVNNLVKIQQSRDQTINKISHQRVESPIKQINSLISKVEEVQTFSIKPYQSNLSL